MLHWYRTESHASPLGHEFRAEYRGRTWRMYRLADGSWKVVPTDRPQQTKTFWKPEDARRWASQAAMTNPGRKRNPQEAHMAKSKNPMTRPGHWKVTFTTASGRVTDSPRFATKAAAEAFRDEQLRTLGRYHDQESAQLYEYMDNGTYRPRGKPKVSHAGKNPIRGARKAVSTEVDEHAATELRLYIDNDGDLYRQRRQPIEKNLLKKWKNGTFDYDRAADGYMYLVDAGAKKYAKEFGGKWNKVFPKPTRRYVANELAQGFGETTVHDMLLPEHNPQRLTAGFQPTYTVSRERGSKQGRWYVHDDHLRTVGAKRGYATQAQATQAAQRLAKPEHGTVRSRNPGRRTKNGAGLGALIGSTIGAVAGFGAGSVPLAALGSLAGGTVGGYFGAPKDRKKRGAAGGAIGGALLGPVGAGIGGYVGGTKADKDYGGRRSNPSRKAKREQNPSDDKITGPNEDGVYSFRGYSIELFGPSSGWYGFMLVDRQRHEEEHAHQAKTRMEAFKIAIDEIKARTGHSNNPSPACGCSHRAASMSRRISNP